MTVRVGINGFGRIGRNFFRAAKAARRRHRLRRRQRPRRRSTTMAHLLKYDSVLGILPERRSRRTRTASPSTATSCSVLSERNPAELPWGDLGVDVVIESTGIFTKRDRPPPTSRPARRCVIVSAPVRRRRRHVRVRRQPQRLRPASRTRSISNASCTTNCFVPLVKVLDDAFGVEQGLMTTVHAYTGDQQLVDGPHSDLRRARGGGDQHHPDVAPARPGRRSLVLESMKGKLDGTSLRVPVPTGSITDFTANLQDAGVGRSRSTPRSPRRRRAGPLKGILRYTEDPIVSSDIVTDPHACIFDAGLTMSMGKLVKVLGWYDNEWGYSNRLVDLDAVRRRQGRRRARSKRAGRSRLLEDSATSTRQAGARAHRLQRAARRTAADHRRLPHPRRVADDRVAHRARRPRSSRASHLGRPKGKPDPKYSMEPVRARLAELAPGVELLENLRFDPGEEGNDPAFVARAGRRASTPTSTTPSARLTAPTPRSSGRRRRCRRRWGGCCSRRSTCCSACATTRSARSSPCSAGPR